MDDKTYYSRNWQFRMVPPDTVVLPGRFTPSKDDFLGDIKPIISSIDTSGVFFKKVPNENVLLAKLHVQDLARKIDDNAIVDDEAEEAILSLTDFFMDHVLTYAARMTRCQGGKIINAKNIYHSILGNYPSLCTDSNYQNKLPLWDINSSPKHIQDRVALVRRAQKKN